MNDTIKYLTPIFRDVFQNSKLNLDENQLIEEMPLYDDMRFTVMIRKVESVFKIKFLLKELSDIQTVGDIIKLIDAKAFGN